MASFVALIFIIFFGEMASAPGRSLLPVYAEAQLHRPPQFTSLLLSAQLLFSGVAAFTGGGLSDSLGQRRVMILGGSGLLVVGLVFLARSPLLLVLMWLYIGLALGLHSLGRQTYIMAVVPSRFLATATAIGFTGLTLGSALGNLLAAPLVDRYGFGRLGIVSVVLAAAVIVAVNLALPDVRGTRQRSQQSFAGYGAVLRRPGIFLIAGMRLVATAYWGAATMLIPLLIYRLARVPSAAAYYSTVMFLFASGCQLLAGRILDRHGCRWPVALLTALLGGASVLTAFYSHSLAGLYAWGILGAGIAWALATATPSIISALVPKEEHGRALGVTQVFTSVGVMLGTQAAGWLANSDPGLVFVGAGLANLAMVVCALALNRHLRPNGWCEDPYRR